MTRLLRRYRRFLASAVLGMWVSALAIGIANACLWDGVTAAPHQPTVAAHGAGDATDDGMAPGCEQFCSNDLPLLGVLQMVQDQPAAQPLVLASYCGLAFLPISAIALRMARTAHPAPGVPLSLRTVRLVL